MEKSLTKRNEGKFIYHDGKYWLVHNYMTDISGDIGYHGWFASPLFFTKENNVKVGVGAGDWCYVIRGAFYKNPEIDVMIKAYKSYLEHLFWCKGIQKETKHQRTLNKIISWYQDLLSKTEVVLAQ